MSTTSQLPWLCALGEIYICAQTLCLLNPLSSHMAIVSILKSLHIQVSVIIIWKAVLKKQNKSIYLSP